MKEEKESDSSTENQVCGACFIYTNTVTYSQTTADTALTKTENQEQVTSAASLSEMNSVQGMLGKETFEVLRDTGYSCVIVRKILVPKEAYTG